MSVQTKNAKTSIGLNNEQRRTSADILNRVLSDQYVLYTKTRKYHWNVTGPLFYSLHQLLETQYEQLDTAIDEVAERTRSLGQPSIGTLKEFLECATLKEQPGEYPDAPQMIADLVADHEAVIKNLREYVDKTEENHDMGTSDFLTAQMEAHEKMAWMLRAFMEDEPRS